MDDEEMFDERRTVARSVKGTLRTFWGLVSEDWREMDHKFFRIVFGAAIFIAVALFWLYFLRAIVP